MEQQYTNYAFISYKREDEKWAKWLQRKLENYKLPSVIRKESSALPKYIRPVFRDGTDLAGGVLIKQLHEELMRSRFLIVICSPNATKSEWVNKEIQAFIDAGRQERIIPFIVSGTPHAQDKSEECFPKALLDIPEEGELLGINVQEVGRSMAFVRLVATMLNVRFDTLWKRHRRNQIRNVVVAATVAVLAILAGVFVWDYNRATYSYYADYVDCWGKPQGVVPLTEQQVSKRHRCYQFEYRRIPFGEPNAYSWRIAKVSYINSVLRPQEHEHTEFVDRYPIQEIEYNKNTGDVSRINYCDVYGKVLLRHVLSERNNIPASVADFVDSQEQKGAGFIGAELTSMSSNPMNASQAKSNIVRFVYERDSFGHIVKQTYHSNNDYQLSRSAVCDADGIFGCAYTLDSLGRRVKITYLDIDGKETQTRKGIAGKVYEYDKHGVISKATYIDMNGHPILNERLWAIYIDNTDENGNIIEETYYDTEGMPCYCKDGFVRIALKYDERGNQIEEAYFDTEGKLCVHKEYQCAKWVDKYDVKGNLIESVTYDSNGKPCLSIYGYIRTIYQYDEKGNKIEETYYDANGEICFNEYGVAGGVLKYDDQGKLINVAFYGVDKIPCYSTDGLAGYSYQYDDRGNKIEYICYDTKGNLCINKNGYARCIYKYDERGNTIETTYYDTEGKLCVSKDGYARWTAKYDERGNTIETTYYDTEEKLCVSKDGYARWTAKYDERGNRIEEAYYDTEGKSCVNTYGYARWTAKYDERGDLTEEIFYDANGNVIKQ